MLHIFQKGRNMLNRFIPLFGYLFYLQKSHECRFHFHFSVYRNISRDISQPKLDSFPLTNEPRQT